MTQKQHKGDSPFVLQAREERGSGADGNVVCIKFTIFSKARSSAFVFSKKEVYAYAYINGPEYAVFDIKFFPVFFRRKIAKTVKQGDPPSNEGRKAKAFPADSESDIDSSGYSDAVKNIVVANEGKIPPYGDFIVLIIYPIHSSPVNMPVQAPEKTALPFPVHIETVVGSQGNSVSSDKNT
jgi:hypothetical protein